MTAVALGVESADEQELVATAAHHGLDIVARSSSADELTAQIAVVRPQLVVVAGTPQHLSARLIAACDGAGARLVVAASTPAERRHARGLGVHDAIEGPLSWDGVGAVVAPRYPPVIEPPPAPPPVSPAYSGGVDQVDAVDAGHALSGAARASGSSIVITVWGPGGAPGRTSVAIAIAAELADAGLRVALADADTHGASIAPALGLLDEAPGFAAACRLAGTGSLDEREFERIAEWHRSGAAGFWVLTGIGRPSRWPELSAARVEGVIAAARDWVDVLVIDTAAPLEQDEELSSDLLAPRRNAATLAAVRAADHVVALAAADPVGLARYLRAHSELLDLADPDRVITVVTKVRSSAIGLNPQAQIRQTLARFGGVDDPVLVPWDSFAFDAALLSGRTLREVAPRSPARLAIRRLVAERLSVPTVAVPPTRAAARFASRAAPRTTARVARRIA